MRYIFILYQIWHNILKKSVNFFSPIADNSARISFIVFYKFKSWYFSNEFDTC